jgi:membrane associated rhomboid family serine protease
MVCWNCGALVGASESHCSACGAPARTADATQRANARSGVVTVDQEALGFVRAIISRPAIFTIVFIAANVFLYILTTLSGGAIGDTLIAYGAKVNSLIDDGQWWRFVTPIFLHVQMPGFGALPVHLLVNMYGLFMLGPYVEKLYGSARFVVFWVVTGVAGVVASYLTVRPDMHINSLGRFLFKAQDVPSAGASGALFGLVGVLFVFGIKYRRELPEGFKRAFGTGMLPMILINLFIGYVGRGFIDNAAHLGGLASGALLALFVGYKRPGERGPVAFVWHAFQALALLLVAFSFLMVARNFQGQPPSLDNLEERLRTGSLVGGGGLSTYLEVINESGGALDRALEGDTGGVDEVIKKLDATSPLDDEDRQLRGELKSVLMRGRVFGALKPAERNARGGIRQRNEIVGAYNDWQKHFSAWARTGGERYGIVYKDGAPDAQDEKR